MVRTVMFVVALMVLPSSLLCAGQADTTDSRKAVRLTLSDGSEVLGTIQSEDSRQVIFVTASGVRMEISRDKIKKIEQLGGEFVRGEYRRIDPNRSRLLFGPTARPLKGGQGYFSAYEIFFPFLAVGIADVVTLAGGISLVPGAKDQLFYIAPKVTIPIPSETVNFAAGVMYLNLTGGTADNTGGGIVYGVGTFGSQYASLTAGLGYGFAQGDFSDQPVIMIGGEAQVSNSIALLTENYFAPGNETSTGLLSFGIRFFGDQLAADLGFFYPLVESGTTGFPFLPWLGFTYNFGTQTAR